MLKTEIFIILTIIILLTCAWLLYWWISGYSDELLQAISEIYHELPRDTAAAATDMEALLEFWQENQSLLYYVIDHSEVDAIETRMLRADEYLRRDKAEEAAVELRELHHLVYYLPRTQGVNLEGIL